jgi:CBS domain-containing protein
MTHVRELMVTSLVTVGPHDTVADVARRMVENRVGAVMVVEEGRLLGIVSERDLVARVIAEGRDPRTATASTVATSEVVTVDADAPVRSVLETFRNRRFRHLPVVEDGRPVGILSTRDFLAFLVEGLEQFIHEERYREQLAAGADPYDHLGGGYDDV